LGFKGSIASATTFACFTQQKGNRKMNYTEAQLRALVARNLTWALKEASLVLPHLLALPNKKGTEK